MDGVGHGGPGRRTLLVAGGLAAGGLAAAGLATRGEAVQGKAERAPGVVPFHGLHQAGVATPQQRHVLLTAFDLRPATTRAALAGLLDRWTAALAAATAGTSREPELTGCAPARLTATLGVGPSLPERVGAARPAGLVPLPAFARERLVPGHCDGDLLVQWCGDDAHALVQAAALLARLGDGTVRARWRQAGFRQDAGGTPRNLFGFKDGTANPDAVPWLRDGGCFLVYRRIRMDVAGFGRLPEERRENAVGRRLGSGAPLGGTAEHDEVDLFRVRGDGEYVVPRTAHVRVANPAFDGGRRMFRRGYSYVGDAGDQGLLFLAFMEDPALFTRVQRRLDADDALTPFTRATASGVYLVPPGAAPGRPLGAGLI